jgi:hypothetical protein
VRFLNAFKLSMARHPHLSCHTAAFKLGRDPTPSAFKLSHSRSALLFSRSALFLFFQALLLVGFTVGLSFFPHPQKPSPPYVYMYVYTCTCIHLDSAWAHVLRVRVIFVAFVAGRFFCFYGVSSRAITHTHMIGRDVTHAHSHRHGW